MLPSPLIGILMGDAADWQIMEHCAKTLSDFGVPWETRLAPADDAPGSVHDYAAAAAGRGLKCLIAGSASAAHFARCAAAAAGVPVLAVPLDSPTLKGVELLRATMHVPTHLPVATFAIGRAGAVNAALFAIAMLADGDAGLAAKLAAFRKAQSDHVKAITLPPLD